MSEAVEEVSGVVEPEGPGRPAVARTQALQRPAASPAVQAAAMAASGLVAGAATVAAVRRVRTHGLPSIRRSRRRRGIVTSRSFLVDIHLLDPRG